MKNRYKIPSFVKNNTIIVTKEENDEEKTFSKEKKKTNWAGCVVVFSFIAIIGVIAAIILAVVANRAANAALGQKVYNTGDEMGSTPLTHLLTGAAIPLTLPNDLTDYVGRTYHIQSDELQMHTVTIQPGPLPTTFDGTNVIATFQGVTLGEGFTMSVVSKQVIRLGSASGVVFSV